MRTSWRIDWISWPVPPRAARKNVRRAAAVCRQRRLERDGVVAGVDRLATLLQRREALRLPQG